MNHEIRFLRLSDHRLEFLSESFRNDHFVKEDFIETYTSLIYKQYFGVYDNNVRLVCVGVKVGGGRRVSAGSRMGM